MQTAFAPKSLLPVAGMEMTAPPLGLGEYQAATYCSLYWFPAWFSTCEDKRFVQSGKQLADLLYMFFRNILWPSKCEYPILMYIPEMQVV